MADMIVILCSRFRFLRINFGLVLSSIDIKFPKLINTTSLNETSLQQ